jgi:hypothetical protein
LPEEVQEGQHRDDADEREQPTAEPDVVSARTEITVASQDDSVGNLRHGDVVNQGDRS